VFRAWLGGEHYCDLVAESAVLAPFAASARRWWHQAGLLAAAVWVAATPAACGVLWFVPVLSGSRQEDGMLTSVGGVLAAVAVVALAVVVRVVARHRGTAASGFLAPRLLLWWPCRPRRW
jgi:hypothetical protein